ncbi:MAG: zinc ribbon domain-containing protein, partial [Mycobacterium sp.]
CGRRKPNLTLADRIFDCDECGLQIDRDLGAAINLARLGVPTQPGEHSPAGSGPVAGRGAMRETEPAPAGNVAGDETSTPHHRPVDQTGTASPQGEAA